MELWINILTIVHVLIALAIIGLVLLQHGKGADMGSGFGGGASSSLFGATGSANFLSRMTAVFATVFFALSLALAYLAANKPKAAGGIMESVKESAEPAKPGAVPAGAPAAAPDDGSRARDVPK